MESLGPFLIPLIFVVFVILAILLGIASAKAAERRRQALMAFAQQHGFTAYVTQRSGCLTGGFGGGSAWPGQQLITLFQFFQPFGAGLRPRADNAVIGTKGERSFYFFDYQYETQSTSTDSEGRTTTSETTHKFGVVAVRYPLAFGAMRIRPEGFFDRIAGAVGFKDIQFESEEFNRRFSVHCSDEKFAFNLLHPKAMEFLLSLPKRDWQISGPYMLTFISGSYDIEDYERIMAEFEGFLNLVPEYLRQDVGFQPSWRSELE